MFRALLALAAAAAAPAAEPPSPHDIRGKILATDQVLLEYRFDASGGSVRLLAQDRERTARIAAGADSVRALAAAVRDDPGSAAAAVLHALLLDPVAADLAPGARLVVVADDALEALPLAALRRDGSFLVERHAVSRTTSVAALAGPPGRRAPRPAPAPDLTAAAVDSFLAANGATLRRPDDAPAATDAPLLADLARGLAAGLPPDVALQRAQVAAIARGEAPAAWARFAVAGRMSAPRAEAKFPGWLVPVGLAGGALALAIALRLTPRTRAAEGSG